MKKILIIEDEVKVAKFIAQGLSESLFEAEVAYDGTVGYRMATSGGYHAIILDVNLPNMNGYEVAKKIRETDSSTPILMLTALSSLDDKITGFDSGADDYLLKPFEFRELLVRINALLKRSFGSQPKKVLSVADLEINPDSKVVKRNGKRIELTAKEYALLEYLMRNRGKIISRIDIAEKVWDLNFDTGTNVIDVYVNFLRKKIDKDFSSKLIHTVIGMGYTLREPVED
ncbi:two component transcriptional regulator, winged helix family [Ochromonadaceae sp. CCMP2298]|nr:two component transcriptional regulator, winged helix family [Ochromonadaceae sp. CCMP2298]